jgi:hypothetical protein
VGLRVCLKFGDPAALGRRLGFTDNPGCARAPGLHVSRYARTADRERRCRYCSITGATPSMRRGCPVQTFPGAPGVPPLDGRALRWCQSPWAAAAPARSYGAFLARSRAILSATRCARSCAAAASRSTRFAASLMPGRSPGFRPPPGAMPDHAPAQSVSRSHVSAAPVCGSQPTAAMICFTAGANWRRPSLRRGYPVRSGLPRDTTPASSRGPHRAVHRRAGRGGRRRHCFTFDSGA